MTELEQSFASARKWFQDIASASGKKKSDAIRQCKEQDREAFALLCMYLDPLTTFHIGEKSLESQVSAEGTPYASVNALLGDLRAVSALSDKLLGKVKSTLKPFKNADNRHFAEQYITKTFTLGITADTVNKACGEQHIRTFSCMLANKYFEHTSAVVGKTVAVTEKLDGIRALAVVKKTLNGCDIKIFSRQGQPITGLLNVEAALYNLSRSIPSGKCYVFDGELLITDRADIPSKEQYKQTTKIVRSKNDCKTGITYNIFDIISHPVFFEGAQSDPYSERRRLLSVLFGNYAANNSSSAITLVPVKLIMSCQDEERTLEAITRLVTEARNRGEEGIMLNVCDAPYVCKRTSNLLKVKVFQDCDLKIIGFEEGTGRFKGTLGALIVDYKGNRLGVGSGLTDADRDKFWRSRKKYLNRVVTVQYFEETNNSDGTLSLRFPIFKELREQGKEVSYS